MFRFAIARRVQRFRVAFLAFVSYAPPAVRQPPFWYLH